MLVINEQVCYWVAARTGGEYYGGGVGIGWVQDGRLIAGAMFDNYNGSTVQGHVALDTQITPRKWLHFCFRYVFDQLKVKKLVGLVDSTNEKAVRYDKHLGYVLEAVIKNGGRHGDSLIFTMTRDQCRYLKD